MWVVGDWGQDSPWSRDTGVKMVKGENNVYTGELSLPEGTESDIKILKSTVSTTSGGDNTWSAVRYSSTLNKSTSYDFGEFTDNLIPNGNFDEGKKKWTPASAIVSYAPPSPVSGSGMLAIGGDFASSCSPDVFTIPPGQTLTLSVYAERSDESDVATMKVVTPQQQTLFECRLEPEADRKFHQFSKTFKSGDVPMDCQITLSSTASRRMHFDSLSLVSV